MSFACLVEDEIAQIPDEVTLGIDREHLPQISRDQAQAFIDFLALRKIKTTFERVPLSSVRPTQSHLNIDKINALKANPEIQELLFFVSADNYLLDGHHRFAALADVLHDVPICRVQLGIHDLIDVASEFEGTLFKGVTEMSGPFQKRVEKKLAETHPGVKAAVHIGTSAAVGAGIGYLRNIFRPERRKKGALAGAAIGALGAAGSRVHKWSNK